VLEAIATALGISVDALYEQAGVPPPQDEDQDNAVLEAIRSDRRLTARQRSALREVYRAFVGFSAHDDSDSAEG
jgi:hypothetical protein